MYISLFIATIPVNYTSEFQELLAATAYNTVHQFACQLTKTTNTHSEYVVHTAFSQQKFLCNHASVLMLYVHCLSCFIIAPQMTTIVTLIVRRVLHSSINNNVTRNEKLGHQPHSYRDL
jgi:hypothetical protein